MGKVNVETIAVAANEPTPCPPSPADQHKGQHPILARMCVMDCDTYTRIVPNSKPAPIDNDCFSGNVFLLIRTPDVDNVDDDVVALDDTPQRISNYLQTKKRRFEFQFQVKLKKIPTGPLFLGCELEEPVKLGRLTKGLVSILLAMIGRINSGFHASFGMDKSHKKTKEAVLAEGQYEKCHVSFPVEASMDRIVVTKPNEVPPKLGYELHETDQSVKRRRRMGAGSVDWNLEDTYTMCLWNAYVDWIKWSSLNVLGVRPFPLGTITGRQPIYLSVYEIKNLSPAEYKKKRPPHNRKDLAVYTRLEFTHCNKTDGGVAEQVNAFEKVDVDYTESSTESVLDEDKLNGTSNHSVQWVT